ncbi:MAG TPA: DUF1554 domain-containing protein, partial [Leptospiraceae bacterium]|nr:DUF1554 domain-containing protein [Leptospiraceae bacterium]
YKVMIRLCKTAFLLLICLSAASSCSLKKNKLALKAIFPLALNTDSSVYLTDLSLSSGTLSPSFSSSAASYSASVDNSVTSVTVTPTANFSSASITVNGAAVNSGSPSGSISLSTGPNTVSIAVSGSGGSTKTYTVEITKSASAASAAVSADLISLWTSQGTLSPVFSSAVTSYTMTLANAVSSITVTPSAASGVSITVNGTSVNSGASSGSITMNSGANVITIAVTSASGSSTYTINVTRLAASVYRIFITAATYNGNLGGVAGADTKCDSDTVRPNDGSTYRALVVDNSGTARRACTTANCTNPAENLNWAFKPSTSYVRASDSTTIMTTNAGGVFPFGTLTNSFTSGATVSYWTGLRSTWDSSSNDCSDWTSSSAGSNGRTGDSSATDSTSIRNNTPSCSTQWYLLCVEQ